MSDGVDNRGLVALQRRISQMADRASAPEPVLVAQAAMLRGVIVRGFSASKGPNDEPWPALKQPGEGRRSARAERAKAPKAGKARKAKRSKRKRPPGKPLLDTSLLRRSVATKVAGDEIVFGVSGARSVIAPVHQFGSPRKGIAARPFLPMDKQGDPLFERGGAAAWMKRAKRALAKYMISGEA